MQGVDLPQGKRWTLVAAGVGTSIWLTGSAMGWVQPPGILVHLLGLLLLAIALFTLFRFRRVVPEKPREDRRDLIHAAELIGRGDFTQPVSETDGAARDELAQALERMRLALRQTTYTSNYLRSVLDSMRDAVFVTAPGGAIRTVNEAAKLLTGYNDDELMAMNVAALLHSGDEKSETALNTARELGEAVLRNRSGQTIPVSFVASTITSNDAESAGEIYVARDITERKRAERRIRYLARYDALTKIPNRMQFQHLLQQSIARSRRAGLGLALLYIDMDRFKEVNDTFGHSSGDRVLEVLTERLTRVLPTEAVLGRLAGDEFALFVDGFAPEKNAGREMVIHLARTVLDAACAAFHINHQEVFLSVSVGIAFCPNDADNVIDVIRNADAAMYHAKQNGGNTFAVYSQEMNAAAVERLMLKSKLRRAVERNEFVVHYQPKVDLKDGRIMGAEALLRWRLPGHGDIPPAQFIPLAEENNLIDTIGEWVLERVCIDLYALRRAVGDPGRIALNLSLKQLRHASFILKCRDIFERYEVDPGSLELEITESTLMSDTERAIQLLDQLADLGLHLSIDDFGTGYSSLFALQQFPISSLKIDQSFVRGVSDDNGNAMLVRTIIDMGHGLGMQVVAEGVETVAQLQFVRDHHCDYAQGKLFGESMPLESLAALLRSQQASAPAFGKLFADRVALPQSA
jgi:diguanylate cyclase (GGDEF)-like protein/PAS domain S-box-containing protein